jgi:hypothetical protein
MVWERRAETRGGLALYALEGVCQCPPYVMATLEELAEHGIQSAESADGITRRNVPLQALREDEDVTPQVAKLRSLLAGQRAQLEDPHDGPLAHRYRLGRDLPPVGGAS